LLQKFRAVFFSQTHSAYIAALLAVKHCTLSQFDYHTNVLIAGAGPAGASTSIFLSKENIPHIIIDKARFPRDKICGDALSAKTTGMLNRLDPNWKQLFAFKHVPAVASMGMRFVSPRHDVLDIPFQLNPQMNTSTPGLVCRRMDFDNFLVGLIDHNTATFLPHTSIEAIEEKTDGLLVTVTQAGQTKNILTRMIVGAEGRGSITAKKLAGFTVNPAHYSAGIRAYYYNVKGMHSQNYIELFFLKEMQPGYLWIFPLPNGAANVGVGMLSSAVAAKKVNLKLMMENMLQTHPLLKERFAQAIPEGKIEGWGLPLGSVKRPVSGNRFVLAGDAASLIDPFTGEGIGNAMVSALVASRTIKQAVSSNDYSATMLKQYDTELYKKLWTELQLSYWLQRLAAKPRLFNFVIGKASRSKELRDTITCMFDNIDLRKKFTSPLFYLKILFNR
jgi:menaquinone-9 beta-reductase